MLTRWMTIVYMLTIPYSTKENDVLETGVFFLYNIVEVDVVIEYYSIHKIP